MPFPYRKIDSDVSQAACASQYDCLPDAFLAIAAAVTGSMSEDKSHMEFVFSPFPSVLYSAAVAVIQPQCSNSMSFPIQPVTLVLVLVGIYDSTSACNMLFCSCPVDCDCSIAASVNNPLAFSFVVLPTTAILLAGRQKQCGFRT